MRIDDANIVDMYEIFLENLHIVSKNAKYLRCCLVICRKNNNFAAE